MGNRSYIAGSLVAVVLLAIAILMPTASPDQRAHASPAIPALLLQTVGEAENQCRIAQDSCMITSDRCKANDDYEARRTIQCRANIRQRYEQCKDRRLSTLAPLRSNRNSEAGKRYRQQAVTQACGRRPDRNVLQKSCPAAPGGCYSRGYCIQQYQRCSTSAYLEDQAHNQRSAPEPPQQTEEYAPPPPPRTAPRRPSGPTSGLPWNDKRPYVYQVEIENTCKHPVKAAYGITHRDGVRSYGWDVLKPGRNTVDFPELQIDVKIFLKQGELANIRARGKLVVYKHNALGPHFVKDDGDFDLRYDLIHTRTPPRPGYKMAQFATLAQGFRKTARRYKIIKCKTKRQYLQLDKLYPNRAR